MAEATVQILLETIAKGDGAETTVEQLKEVNQATEGQVDAQDKARASFDETIAKLKEKTATDKEHAKALDDATEKTKDLDDSVLKLPDSLRAMAGGLGAATLAAGVMKAGFDAWLQQNPELQASLEQTTAQVSKLSTGVLSEWFETWIMKAETGKSILDSVTIALGGETAAMQAARAPMAGYADDKEQAAINTRSFILTLDKEAAAAKRASDALALEVEQRRLRNELDAAQAGLEANRKKREIDAGQGSPEDKAKAKNAVDAQAAMEEQQRAEEERAKETQVAEQQAKMAADEAARVREQFTAKESDRSGAGLHAALVAQNKSLAEQLAQAEAQAKSESGNGLGPATDETLAEIESIKKQMQDNTRGMASLKPGDANALLKEAQELWDRAAAADKEAAQAALTAEETRKRNDVLNQTGRVKTQDRVEQLLPPAQPGGYNPSPLDGDTNPLGKIEGNKAPNRYDRIPAPPPSNSPIGGGGNPLPDLGAPIQEATAALNGSPLESGIGELGGTLKDFATAVTEQNAKLDAAIKAAAADAKTALSQIKASR